MSSGASYKGNCFCGAVEISVTGDPVGMGFCHCSSCRQWSATPITAYTLWNPDAVRITQGADNVVTYHKTPQSYRKWCKLCGGHLLMEHPDPAPPLTCVYPAIIPGLAFVPSMHLNYGETALHLRDGLPKLRDYPKEFGGSGVEVPE